MDESVRPSVVPDGEAAGEYDTACGQVSLMTEARCAAVVIIDGHAGSGYSVIGPLEAQVLLPDILRQMADTLRGQLVKNLQ